MQKQINILFLGGSKRISVAEKFIEAGRKINITVNIFSYELSKHSPISFVGEIIIGLKWDSRELYTHLTKIIVEKKIDIVLPFLDAATVVAARLEEMRLPGLFVPVSDVKTCETFFNKVAANNWCIANGIYVPDDVSGYPLIAKPIEGYGSIGIMIIHDAKGHAQVKDNSDYIIQKFIKGKEFSIDAYISPKSGKIISIVSRERLETQGGESIQSITFRDTAITEFCENIITKSKLVGPITIQILKETETGRLYFMEINPRFGGAVLNSIAAGADSPLYIIKDFLGEENERNENWEDKILMIRRFTEYYRKCK